MDAHNPGIMPDFEAAGKLTQKDFDLALSKIYPRTYCLEIPERFVHDGKVVLFADGCQGSGSAAQYAVGELKNEVAKKIGEPLLNIYAGDNIYNSGATNPVTDPQFQRYFYGPYYSPHLTEINGVPSLMGMGNHDGDYHKPSMYARKAHDSAILGVPTVGYYLLGEGNVGWVVEKNEGLHGLLPTKLYTFAQQLDRMQKPVLSRNELSAWNMFGPSYSVIIGMKELFFLNTNCFFIGLMSYIKKQAGNEVAESAEIELAYSQIAWFKKAYDLAVQKGRYPILITHHPANLTLGKQLISPDTNHYISDAQIAEYNQLLAIEPPTKSFTDMLRIGLEYLKVTIDFKINAHTHFLNFVRDPSFGCQLTVGAGGGKLQEFIKYNHPYSGCQLQQHGFAALTIPLKNDTEQDKTIGIDIYTIDGLHLKYDSTSHLPIRTVGTEPFEALREKVLAVSQLFYDSLPLPVKDSTPKASSQGFFSASMKAVSQGISSAGQLMEYIKPYHKSEAGIVQDIVGYFNQTEAPLFDKALLFLQAQLIELEKFGVTEQSFITMLHNKAPELFSDKDESHKENVAKQYSLVV